LRSYPNRFRTTNAGTDLPGVFQFSLKRGATEHTEGKEIGGENQQQVWCSDAQASVVILDFSSILLSLCVLRGSPLLRELKALTTCPLRIAERLGRHFIPHSEIRIPQSARALEDFD